MMLMLLLAVVSTTLASNKDGVNENVNASFKKEFSMAQDVQWETGKDIYKATFRLNNQVLFAYFAANGEMVAVTRNILSVQLPIRLLASLKNEYSSHWITELFEVSSNSGTDYYVTLENADNTLVLKSANGSSWQSYKKIRKDAQ